MKQPIKQMLTASAVMGVIFSTAFSLVETGTAKEQAERTITTTTTTTAATTTTAPMETLYYFESVPMDIELQDFIIRQSENNGIDPAIVMAMIDRESRYNADNMGDNGNSYGLMQIQPRWHSKRMERLGCNDLLDPYQNVTVGIDYLCELLNRYGDVAKALVAYNQGSYKGTVTEYAKAVLDGAERIGDVYVK